MSSKFKGEVTLNSGGRFKKRGTGLSWRDTANTPKESNTEDGSNGFDFAEIKKKARNPFSKTTNDVGGGA